MLQSETKRNTTFIVQGSEEFYDFAKANKILSEILPKTVNTLITTHSRKGAEPMGEKFAMLCNHQILRRKPDYKKNWNAGYLVNQVLTQTAKYAVFFFTTEDKESPSSGIMDCYQKALQNGCLVYDYNLDTDTLTKLKGKTIKDLED